MKPEYRIIEHSWDEASIRHGDVTICRLSIHDFGVPATEENQLELESRLSVNAELICELLNKHQSR